MTTKELDALVSRLEFERERKKQIQLVKAQAEMEAISKCAEAYYDGLYDLAKEIKATLKE